MNENDSSLSGCLEAADFEKDMIQSGYPDDFEDDPNDINKYSLKLYPQDPPYFVAVQVYFDVSPPYPKTAVKCVVKNLTLGLQNEHSMGLSEHQIQDLQDRVYKCAHDAQQQGDVAVNLVVELVKEYLNGNNKANVSLHDDMQRATKKQSELDKAKCSIVPIRPDKSYDKTYPPFLQPGDTKLFFKDQLHSTSSSLSITCRSTIGDRENMFCSHDEKFKDYVIHEYVLDLSPVLLKKEIEDVRKEFNRAQKSHHHASLLKYLAWDCKGDSISNVIHVVSQNCSPLSDFNLPYPNMKSLATHLILGLEFLHKQDLLHGLLTVDSVFVDAKGRHLIGDYGFAKKLLAQSLKAPFKKFSHEFTDACDEKGNSLDVLLFGHVMYHMAVGFKPDFAYPSIPPHFDTVDNCLREFIKDCVVKDRKYRPKFIDLAKHDFIVGESPLYISNNSIEKPLRVSFSTEDNISSMEDHDDNGDNAWNRSNRLKNDYKIMGTLGKGGFGAVLKVRNNTDGCLYAMKVVQLNRSSKHATLAMRDEVKLLSQLKHNHIVGYNMSWVEIQSRASVSSQVDFIEAGDSFQPTQQGLKSTYDEIWDESSENCRIKPYNGAKSSSFIVFEDSCQSGDEDSSQESEASSNSVTVMFIQMEFCENTTLRKLMNDRSMNPRLHENLDLVLKVIRQIVDALEYIHQKDIRHRDLKPENIFLDSKDEVKIGDFGLANIGNKGKSDNCVVGTLLYTAPEVLGRHEYSTRVDIYSLGVICFEMIRGPFDTQSERCHVLQDLRKPSIIIPPDVFPATEKHQQLEQLVREMLSHDVKVRPTASEISLNELLPPRLAHQGLREIVRHVSSEQGSQRKSQFLDILFSHDITNTNLQNYIQCSKPHIQQQDFNFTKKMNLYIIDRMTPVFQKRGAIQCPLPFLLPKCDITDRQKKPFVMLSSQGHYQVLPCNFKLNLAKHVVQNKITNLKRYGFHQVFRKSIGKNDTLDPSPRVILEGSYDIISSAPSIIAQAEVLSTVIDVIKKIPELKMSSFTIYVNHSKIIKAILLFYEIDEIHHSEILKYLFDYSHDFGKLKDALKKECDSLDYRRLDSLLAQFKFEGPIDKIHKHVDDKDSILSAVQYKKGKKIGNIFKDGLREILQIFLLVTSEDLDFPMDIFDPETKIELLANQLTENFENDKGLSKMVKLSTGIINDPNSFTNFMFKLGYRQPEKDIKYADELAVGGDFNILLKQWAAVEEWDKSTPLPSAVGVNFLLGDMTNILSEIEQEKSSTKRTILVSCDAVDNIAMQVFAFIKKLWGRGLTAHQVHNESEDFIKANHHVVFQKDFIIIHSDASYMKQYGYRDEKAHIYVENKTLIHKYKSAKIGDCLDFLIDMEGNQVQSKTRANSGCRQRRH